MVHRTQQFFSRRLMIGGTAAYTATARSLEARGAKLPVQVNAPSFHRFRLGAFHLTVVSDGVIVTGDPKKTFVGAPAEQIASTLFASFLPTDRVVFDENVLVVDTGSKVILFDTGSGALQAYGPGAGRLLANLETAGIRAADVDAVVLSHGHADHVCGLVVQGRITFENAQFYINQVDHDFWLDPERAATPLKLFHEQALLNLVPVRDRLTFIKDGAEFLPGVQALPAPGHTPGHTVFMISSGGETLAYLADLARHHILDLEAPGLEFIGDIDPGLCVQTRTRMLDMVAANRIPILSYHFPFPGVGHVAKWGDRHRFYPSDLQQAADPSGRP